MSRLVRAPALLLPSDPEFLQRQVADKSQKLRTLQQNHDTVWSELDQQRNKYATLENKFKASNKEINDLKEETRRLRVKIASLKRQTTATTSEAEKSLLHGKRAAERTEELQEQGDDLGRGAAKTSEEHNENIMEIKNEQQEMEVEDMTLAEEEVGLHSAYSQSRGNCLIFSTGLDESPYPSVTQHSLELGLAVLEVWPSKIRAEYSFKERARIAFSHLGLCETPLSPGHCRLRWRCRCGAELFDDYMIPTISGISMEANERDTAAGQTKSLRDAEMERRVWEALHGLDEMIGHGWFCGVSVVMRSSSQTGSSIGNIFKELYRGALGMIQKLGIDLRNWKTEPEPELPSHRDPMVGIVPPQRPVHSQDVPIHLLTCLPEQSLGTRLHQKHISNVEFDRGLFVLLKSLYEEHRGKLHSVFTMRKPTGIHFNKFTLLSTRYVDFHAHEKHCISRCSCLPPKNKVTNAEYDYNPVPPKRWPPMGPNALIHLLNSPSCIDEKQVWMLKQFPKKLQGELEARFDEEVIGWGIYFQEGLHWTKIWAAVLAIVILGSFLFGVLWYVFQKDAQGAFGIASWWVSLCTVILAWLAARDIGA